SPAGVLLFIYSLLLTRGSSLSRGDTDDPEQTTLTGRFGHCSQELLNLLLMGRATSNVFDGDKELGDSGLKLRGVSSRATIGYLTHLEALRYVQVGSHYKTPHVPIWVVGSSSHFTVLFALEKARRAREGTILEIKERLRQLEEEGSALLATSKEAYAAAASAAAARGAGGVGAARVVMVSAPLSAPGGGGSSSSVGGTGRSGSSSGSGDRDTMASPAGAGGGAGGAAVTGRPRGRPRKSAVGGEEGREGAGGGGTPRIFTLPKGIVVGKRVRHPTWGVGKVVEVEEEERSVEVDFVIGPVRLVGELEVGKLVKA
ncbi:hypothetical protein VYU27_004620, partial [Nannochloropsis oceanica]